MTATLNMTNVHRGNNTSSQSCFLASYKISFEEIKCCNSGLKGFGIIPPTRVKRLTQLQYWSYRAP